MPSRADSWNGYPGRRCGRISPVLPDGIGCSFSSTGFFPIVVMRRIGRDLSASRYAWSEAIRRCRLSRCSLSRTLSCRCVRRNSFGPLSSWCGGGPGPCRPNNSVILCCLVVPRHDVTISLGRPMARATAHERGRPQCTSLFPISSAISSGCPVCTTSTFWLVPMRKRSRRLVSANRCWLGSVRTLPSCVPTSCTRPSLVLGGGNTLR